MAKSAGKPKRRKYLIRQAASEGHLEMYLFRLGLEGGECRCHWGSSRSIACRMYLQEARAVLALVKALEASARRAGLRREGEPLNKIGIVAA